MKVAPNSNGIRNAEIQYDSGKSMARYHDAGSPHLAAACRYGKVGSSIDLLDLVFGLACLGALADGVRKSYASALPKLVGMPMAFVLDIILFIKKS